MSDDLIHPSTCIDQPCHIGPETRIWHFCHLMSGCRIGSRCSLGQNVFVASEVTVGDGVKIQNNVSLYAGVELEDEVFIGPSVVFTNVKTPRAAVKRNTPEQRGRTLVRRGASIGANATVICGVTIGSYAMIGAGSLVNEDIPAHAIMVGNPVRQMGWACICGASLDERFNCPECARKAHLMEGLLKFSDS